MRRGIVACTLWPLSALFRLLVAGRRCAYAFGWADSVRIPVAVIVVGNLFVGGTGKTPLTIWLVEMLRHAGYCPGVISRGYGSDEDGVRNVTRQSHARIVGDEPALIAQRTGCPLMVGRDRVAAARALLAAYPETNVIVSDDGLQHYRLRRDIEIVLSDARGVGNGWLLPAGPLREPASRRRDFSVCNVGTPGTVDAGRLATCTMQLLASVAEQLVDRSQRTTLAAIAAASPAPSILAAAGIGNPARFFASLTAAGLVFDTLPLPDHYAFDQHTFDNCNATLILITEKDAVKCQEIPGLADDARLWVVPVCAQIAGPFAEKILEKLRGYATA